MRKEDENWLNSLKNSVDGYEEPLPDSLKERLEKELVAFSTPMRKWHWGRTAAFVSAVAAVLILFLGIGLLYNEDIKNPEEVEPVRIVEKHTAPGEGKPLDEISVADGRRVADATIECKKESVVIRPPVEESPAPEKVMGQVAGQQPSRQQDRQPEALTEEDKQIAEQQTDVDTRGVQARINAEVISPEEEVPDADEQARWWRELLAEEAALRENKKDSRFMSGIFASGANFISTSSENAALKQLNSETYVYPADMPMVYGEYAHKMPLNLGLSVGWNLKYGLSLESGLNYSLFISDLRVSSRNSEETRNQKLHYLGIPVRLNWTFVAGRGFAAYLGVKGEVSKCIYANIGSDRIRVKDFQYSIGAFAGVQYNINRHIGLYLEPGISTYLNNDLKDVMYEVRYNNGVQNIPVESKITTTDYVFTIGFGLRFSY